MSDSNDDVETPLKKLIQVVNRLERMLTSQAIPENTDNNTDAVIQAATTLIYANPSKIVKRWIGTSSGTAGAISLDDIAQVAKTMLDRMGVSANGRDLLMQLSSGMQTEGGLSESATEDKYVKKCTREIESYLLSLAVRLLWRQNEAVRALDLATKAIRITTVHMEEASKNTYGVGSANGMFPLLARLYRLQSLVAESCNPGFGLEMGQRQHLLSEHRMAVIRRDVDTQATLLNIMLRDLLNCNQGENIFLRVLCSTIFPHCTGWKVSICSINFIHLSFFIQNSGTST